MANASNIPADMIEFIHTKVNSFLRWDLMRHFNAHPALKETAETIAQHTGRDTQTVQTELEAMVADKLLMAEDKDGVRRYRMGKSKATRELISQFMEACHDRHFRIEAIQEVIKAMNFSPRYDF